MRVLVYATYGPLDIMCVLLIIIEFKFTVMPLVSAWINLNQRIEVTSLSKTAADVAGMSDWRSINRETADDFPGVLPGRRVPYELFRDKPGQRAAEAAPVSDGGIQRPQHVDTAAARITREADGDSIKDVGDTAVERGSMPLDANSTTSPSGPAQLAIGHLLPAASCQCHNDGRAVRSVSPAVSPVIQAPAPTQLPRHYYPTVVELGGCTDGVPLWQCSDA